jgi:adenylate cyclase
VGYQAYDWKYQQERKRRIVDAASKIAARHEAVKAGRLIPEQGDLPIGTGRRMNAAVLFLDISSFTSRPSNTTEEQEGLLRALSIFFTEMFRIVKDYDGDVEKNTGDGLMAYFVDGADASGAERAVACAMTMMNSNTELAPHVLKTAEPFLFRIAIDYGPITVASIGAPKLFGSIVAIGITANIANKMLRSAHPNQIVIGEKAAMALPDDWRHHCKQLAGDTGFVYTPSQEKYPFYLFDARWVEPAMPLSELAPRTAIPPPPPFMLELLAGRKK